jgi:serine/threonine protein kinase/Flp pilus assembly protein TadD
VRAELIASVEAAVAARMPDPGDELFGFTLVEELGRGSFARVYLATQQSLAGRHVAVKVTLRATREPDRLARLQHTNIVPVYSVHEAGTLQVVCMPFLGRTTVAHLLGAFRHETPSRHQPGRRPSHTLKAGSTASSLGSGAFAASGPRAPVPVGTPAGLIGDVPAVLRAVAALAAGLAHAHARGILHLDIKPANVLLADPGEPMLLDFNLSYDTTVAQRELVGGTVQYMAPEQLLDLRTKGRGGVDGRTDVYSLGVLAYEMLTGAVPFPAVGRLAGFDELTEARYQPFAPASRLNPAVTPAVDAILAKLLAPDPDARYQSADALRADLERHLADQPLLGVREPSPRERFRKWRRRNPGVATRVAAACLLGLVFGGGFTVHRQAAAEAGLRAAADARTARAALPALRLDLVLTDDPQAAARGKERAAALLARYGLPGDAGWRDRDLFARLPAADRDQLAGDLGELLLLLAHAAWRDANARPGADRKAAAVEALALNRAARRCFPDDAVPPFRTRQFGELADATGEFDNGPAADPDAPRTPRDHFLDAVEALTAGKHTEAGAALEKAIAGQPDHGAAHLCLALCRHNLGQYARAVERYDAARVLLPTDPRPFFYRGLVFGAMRRPALAEPEFTKALDLDPNHREALRNRAVARRELGKLAEAEADLTRGLDLGGPAVQFLQLRAAVRAQTKNTAGAAEDRAAAAALPLETDMDYQVRGWARYQARQYQDALADYREAEARNPRSVKAVQMQVRILTDDLDRPGEALAAAARLTAAHPECALGHAGKAVVLAKLGRRAEAHKAAATARALSDEPLVAFTLGCVYALTGKAEPKDLDPALAFLRQAFKDGHRSLPDYEHDPDLAALRGRPDFAAFLTAARELSR